MNIVKFNLARLDINNVHIPPKTRELLELPIEVELDLVGEKGYRISPECAKRLGMQDGRQYPDGPNITWFLCEEITILI